MCGGYLLVITLISQYILKRQTCARRFEQAGLMWYLPELLKGYQPDMTVASIAVALVLALVLPLS